MKIEHNMYGSLRLCLSSGDDEYRGCNLTIAIARWYVTIPLPAIIKPARQWVDCSKRTWSTPDMPGYWKVIERAYGFSLGSSEAVGAERKKDFLLVYLGRQSMDSETEQNWSCFLPWVDHRFVRFSLYDLEGKHFWTQLETPKLNPEERRKAFVAEDAAKAEVPKVSFKFQDFDGEEIIATTHLQEREWWRGTKWCSWLSVFYRPIIRRSLDIEFSKEVGPRKGSWKGGTIGHGAVVQPGELHEAAFRRYCVENDLTFIEQV